jgi:hypothetical protein
MLVGNLSTTDYGNAKHFIRYQRSEIRTRTLDKRRWIGYHAPEHCHDFMACFSQNRVIGSRKTLAVMGEIEPRVGLAILAICVGQFTHEVYFVSPLRPCFPNVGANRPRGTSDLVCKRIPLFWGKAFARPKNLHREFIPF